MMAEVKQWAVGQGLELLIVSPSEDSATFYGRAGFVPETDFVQLRLRAY